jgi:hypothetical protein
VIGACGEQGGPGCICESDAGCASGLGCSNGLCSSPLATLTVGNSDVRACDLLLDGVGRESQVTLGSQVRGELARRPPRMGVSLMALDDTAISEPVLLIEKPSGSAGTVGLVSATCFDRTGATVANAGLALR